MPSKEKEKGNLVEDIVALLHESPGITVERRVRLPSLAHGSQRRREIDILLTTEVAGYPVRLAIECKNERKAVGTGRIDEFIGRLNDVGIPVSHGIFVSPVGYTSNGLARARAAGIRPLLLDGLTSDRLAVEVSEAFQSIVHLVATWRQISRFDNVGQSFDAPWASVRAELPKELGSGMPAIMTLLWLLWVRDEISPRIGLHHIFVDLHEGFQHSANESPLRDGHVIIDLEVVGYVAHFAGKARKVGLRHAESSQIEKLRIDAEFEAMPDRVNLDRFETEEALSEFLTSKGTALQQRIRVPRIVGERTYWPPTLAAIERIQQLKASGEEITFERVEGASLWSAWRFSLGDDGPEEG